MIKFSKIVFSLSLFLPIFAFSQSAQRVNTAILPSGSAGNIATLVPNASVFVCQFNVQTQCTVPIAVYSDPALANLISQPVLANASGVYSYYVAAGTQLIEKVCNVYNQCSPTALTVGTSGTAVITPGNNFKLPAYPSTTGSQLAPSNVTVDSTGNNLSVPGTIQSTSVGSSPNTAPICPNGTGGAFTTVGCSAGGSGTVTPSPQFSLFYQPNSGTSGTAVGDPNITSNGSGSLIAKIDNGVANAASFQSGGGNNGIANAAATNPVVTADPSYSTTEQYSPTSTIPNWPNGLTVQDLRGGHNLFLTHNAPVTYNPYGDANFPGTLFFTQNDGAPSWNNNDLYEISYRMVLNTSNPGGNFDFPNLGAGAAGGWAEPQALSIQSTVNSSGIDETLSIGSNKSGTGDHVGGYINSFDYISATTGQTDEGKKALATRTQQAAAEASYTCTSGCSTGSVHLLGACRTGTNACGPPVAAGPGGYLIDSSQTPISNTITNMVNSSLSSTTMSALTTGTTVLVSNFWGTQQANISTPNRMYCYYSTSVITSVANASGGNSVYTGTITNGANNALANCAVNITGFGNSVNNGAFTVVSSTSTTITLNNASGASQSGSATETVYPFAAMETFAVTLVGGSGADTTHELCFATSYHECVVPTSAVNTSGSTWTIQAPLRHAHANGGYVFQGGMAGYALEITAYTPTASGMIYRYMFDVLGSTDANTLQTTWWFQGRPVVLTRLANLNINNSLYGCSNVTGVSNTGTAVTANFTSQCAAGLAIPDYTGGVFYFTNGSNSTINGNCTGIAWTNSTTFTCTNSTATGSNTGMTATIQLSKAGQNGLNVVNLWPMAEVLDIQDYSTVPPVVDGTLTLEPNPNLVIAPTDILEEQRPASDITNGATISNYVINPYQFEYGMSIGIGPTPGVSGSAPQGGGISVTSNAAFSVGNGGASNVYKGQGGFFIPPNMINFTGPYNIGLDFNQGPSINQGLFTMVHSATQVADPIYCYRLWDIYELSNQPFYLQNCPNSKAVSLVTSGLFTIQTPSNIFTGSTSLNGPLNSINNANVSTTGGFISGQGINYAPYSNTLTASTWGNVAGATGTTTCAITDDLGNPACTLAQTSTGVYAWQDFNIGGLTPLTASVSYVMQARMKGHTGGELITIGGGGAGSNVFLTTSWANYCTVFINGGGFNSRIAGINLNANGATIDVSNVVTATGTSCSPAPVPIITQNNQFLTLTNVNHAGTLDATNYTLSGAAQSTVGGLSVVIASGTAALTTAAITAPACGTTVTVSAPNVLTTDTISVSFNAAPAGTNAGLVWWPTAGNVNFAYCPGVTETPAAATINWRVIR